LVLAAFLVTGAIFSLHDIKKMAFRCSPETKNNYFFPTLSQVRGIINSYLVKGDVTVIINFCS
jgi:hypothetical protein